MYASNLNSDRQTENTRVRLGEGGLKWAGKCGSEKQKFCKVYVCASVWVCMPHTRLLHANRKTFLQIIFYQLYFAKEREGVGEWVGVQLFLIPPGE